MQKSETQLQEIKIVGITTRTDNARLFEQDPSTNDVAATVQKYFHGGLPSKIMHRAKPGVTYCIYTEYETDLNGKFTYVIGEEVTSFDDLPEGFTAITLPAQKYAKFTNKPGSMPDVCIDMWKKYGKIRLKN